MAAYREPVTEHVAGPVGVVSSKKNGPRTNVAVMPHHTVTLASNNGTGATALSIRLSPVHTILCVNAAAFKARNAPRPSIVCEVASRYPHHIVTKIHLRSPDVVVGHPAPTSGRA
ncbi:hypothetical protein TNCV_3938481 [Trichonephila clavipes]|nr:hypothetical protein TNCV_3938481 [Trichonephila clavipes]